MDKHMIVPQGSYKIGRDLKPGVYLFGVLGDLGHVTVDGENKHGFYTLKRGPATMMCHVELCANDTLQLDGPIMLRVVSQFVGDDDPSYDLVQEFSAFEKVIKTHRVTKAIPTDDVAKTSADVPAIDIDAADAFYELCDTYYDLSEATIRSRISSMKGMGTGDEVVDLLLGFEEEETKVALIKKAMELSVKFSQEDFANLDGELPDTVFAELAKYGDFYLDNPHFNPKDFTWDDFYGECGSLPDEIVAKCLPRLREFGPSDEVVEAIQSLNNDTLAEKLYSRAIACGVVFSHDELVELGKAEDVEYEIEEYDRKDYVPRKKIGFWRALGMLFSSTSSSGGYKSSNSSGYHSSSSSAPKRHSGRCDGDCAHCPPHYGYRHGRWYYGHDHVEGCVFGGNKCSGGRD